MNVPPKKSQLPAIPKSKYELNIAEFPISLLSTRSPKDLKVIEYQDTITGKNGNLIPRTWRVKPSVDYGFGSNQALATLFELFQIWKEQGFQTSAIRFGSVYHLVKRMNLEDTETAYERIRRDLNAFVEISIEAKNAFWDNEKRAYVDKTFHLFESVTFYRREEKSKQQTLPFAYIEASKELWGSIEANALLTLRQVDSALFHSLTPTEQRLALYLGKMLRSASEHWRDALQLARQLPILAKNYKDVKKQLTKACEGLLTKKFPYLTAYHYEPKRDGKGDTIFFFKKEAKQHSKGKPRVSRKATPEKEAPKLVQYFYQLFHGIKDVSPQQREIDQASELIATHSFTKALHLVEFSYRIAQETNYHIQIFGGILPYTTRALADYDQQEKKRARQEQERAQRRERERKERETFEQGEQLLTQLSPAEQERLFQEAKAEVLTETPIMRKNPDGKTVTVLAKTKVLQKLLSTDRQKGAGSSD